MSTETEDAAARVAAERQALIEADLDGCRRSTLDGDLSGYGLLFLTELVSSWHWCRDNGAGAVKLTAAQHAAAKGLVAHAIRRQYGGRYEHAGVAWTSDDGITLRAEAIEGERR